MKSAFLCWVVAALTVTSLAGQESASTSQSPSVQTDQKGSATTPAKPPVKRVHLKLDGFELSKNPQAGPQIGGASRGMGAEITLYAPDIGLAYSTNPLFSWSNAGNEKSLVFRIFDEDGNSVYETTVSGYSLQYPASAPPLEPGKTYSWMVQSELGLMGSAGKPIHFIVLGHADRDAVASALRAVSNSQDSELQQARVFTDKRIWYDAIAAYSELIRKRPREAELYEKRGEIYDQISATQKLAEDDFQKADQLLTEK